MHPRQANFVTHAQEVTNHLAGNKEAGDKQALSGAPTVLWKYTDPDGGVFFLTVKRMTPMKSPLTGETFTPKPERISPSSILKDMKEDAKADKTVNASESDHWKVDASESDRWKA